MTLLDAFTPIVLALAATAIVNAFSWALVPAPDTRPVPVTLRVVSVRTNKPRRPSEDSDWLDGDFIIPGVPACQRESDARS